MANYEAACRSNYFRVKDEQAFRAWAKARNLEIFPSGPDREFCDQYDEVSEVSDHQQSFMISHEDGTWPVFFYDDNDKDCECDVVEELAQHLHPDDIAVLMEAGHEKLRYVCGHAIAVNAKGETVAIHLSDIYDKARHLGENLTFCEY